MVLLERPELQFTFIFHGEVAQPGRATVEHNALNYRSNIYKKKSMRINTLILLQGKIHTMNGLFFFTENVDLGNLKNIRSLNYC